MYLNLGSTLILSVMLLSSQLNQKETKQETVNPENSSTLLRDVER